MKLKEIASRLDARLDPHDADVEITGVAPIESAGPGQITFVADPRYVAAAKTTRASAIIVDEKFPALENSAGLRTKNPKYAYARVVELCMLFLQRRAVRSRVGSRGQAPEDSPDATQPNLLLFVVSTCNLLDEINDAAPQLGIWNTHERLGQRQAVGGRKEIGHVGRGRGLLQAFRRSSLRQMRSSLEKERHWDL